MRKSKYSEVQIAGILKEAEAGVSITGSGSLSTIPSEGKK